MQLALLLAWVGLAIAISEANARKPKVHQLDWEVSWKTVNPDGLHDRPVIAINDQWPLPVVKVAKGDRLVVNVTNNLRNPERNSSIHWHGLFMNGSSHMDGATWLTQCPSAPGTSFVYDFVVDQPGTYWYHTHVDGLYPDGYRQMFLVEDDDAWFEDLVDEEIQFSFSDWYHELIDTLKVEDFMTRFNPQGNEPVPNSLLFNDSTADNFKVRVEPEKTYRLRIANVAALSSFIFYIPGHNFTIVEVDGVYTDPSEASSIHVSPAQRYSLLFNTTSDPDAVYQLVQVADQSVFDSIPSDLVLNHTAWLYSGHPSSKHFKNVTHEDIYRSGLLTDDNIPLSEFSSSDLEYFDDMELVPHDHLERLGAPDHEITLNLEMTNLMDGVNYAFFNDLTWTHAKVPTLYSALSAPDDETASNQTIYGSNTNTFVLQHDEIVQLVLNNNDDGMHPFHLHGHNFQCLLRGDDYGDEEDGVGVPYDPKNKNNRPFPLVPMRRDTFDVKPLSHFVIRFKADNPGVWFFHCHVDWHLMQGLAVEFVEAPVQLRQNYKVHAIPSHHFKVCSQGGLPHAGNAAARTDDFLNLRGENLQRKNLPKGFTLKGYVAMFACVLCAFIGIGSLLLYGLSDMSADEETYAEQVLDEDVPVTDISNPSTVGVVDSSP